MNTQTLHRGMVELLMKSIVGAVKFLLFFLVVMLYVLHHAIFLSVFPRSRYFNHYLLLATKQFAKFALIILNVKILHPLDCHAKLRGLFISNHVSYIDILVILSHHPTFFITSIEMKDSFFLGQLSQLALSIFVERRKSHRSQDAINGYIREISKHLTSGHNVCFFPEGTTSNGLSVLPFKSPLFKAAQITQSTVHLLALRYNKDQMDTIAWYGEMTFFNHFYNLCCLPKIEVELKHVSSSCIMPNTDLNEFVLLANTLISQKI